MRGKKELARIALPIDVDDLVVITAALHRHHPDCTVRAYEGRLVIEVDEAPDVPPSSNDEEGASNA